MPQNIGSHSLLYSQKKQDPLAPWGGSEGLTPCQMAKFLSRSADESSQVVDPYCVKQPLFAPSASKSHGRSRALAFASSFVATRRPWLTRFLRPVTRSVLQARHVSRCAQHERAGRKIGVKKGLVRPWPRRAKHSLGRLCHAGSTFGSL